MKLWSRGLGRRELIMDFTHYAIRGSEDGGIEIFGVTEQPVSWEFRVHIEQEDIPGLVNVALSKPVRRMVIRRIFTAIATIWKRRHFKVPEGLEERVRTAHSHVMDRPRINRQVSDRADSGTVPTASIARTTTIARSRSTTTVTDDSDDGDDSAGNTAAGPDVDTTSTNDTTIDSVSKVVGNSNKTTGNAIGIS
ncbi:MAG: hypothetical protein M1456_00615 [Actinobacteria bacterium]|nr:hypothetical protein [Actinomycetota bacterium]